MKWAAYRRADGVILQTTAGSDAAYATAAAAMAEQETLAILELAQDVDIMAVVQTGRVDLTTEPPSLVMDGYGRTRMSGERPAGPNWWCPTCQGLVAAVITAEDTETHLVDRVRCPTCQAELGTVTAERVTAPAAAPTPEIR
jgi:hypothetical protein